MKKSPLLLKELQLQAHWYYIGRYRARATALIDGGVRCCDPRLVTLSNQILRHGMAASRLWRQYQSSPHYHPAGEEPEAEEPTYTKSSIA